MPGFVIGGSTWNLKITDQTLPAPSGNLWSRVQVGSQSFAFRKSAGVDYTFSVSGYIEEATIGATREAALGLNTALRNFPEGIFTDGFADQYYVHVDSWSIKPRAGQPAIWDVQFNFIIVPGTWRNDISGL